MSMLALDTFSQTGFAQALIQKKENIKPYLNAAWTVNIVRALIIALLLFLCAPFVASFFKAPAAVPIIKIIGLSVLFLGFSNIAVVYFEKELEFHKYFAYHFTGTFLDLTTAIVCAIKFKNVWALILGYLAGNLGRCVMSYLIHPYRPRFHFDLAKAGELFKFGRWVLGSAALIFISSSIDPLLIGRLLGTTALGLYQMAFRISNLPATEISYVIESVTLPAYSKIQNSSLRLKTAYLKIMRLTIGISFPMSLGLILLSPEFTVIILGEKWISMITAMQVLAVAGLFKSAVATASPLFKGSGFPEYEFRMQSIRTIVMLGAIYPLILFHGIIGAAVCVCLSLVAMTALWYRLINKITQVSWKEFFGGLVPILGSSLIMGVFVMAGKVIWRPVLGFSINSLLVLAVLIAGGVIVYAAMLFAFKRLFSSPNILEDMKIIFHSLRKKNNHLQ